MIISKKMSAAPYPGVPLYFRFCVLAEINLTGERPFQTRIQETPATTPGPNPSPHKLAKTLRN